MAPAGKWSKHVQSPKKVADGAAWCVAAIPLHHYGGAPLNFEDDVIRRLLGEFEEIQSLQGQVIKFQLWVIRSRAQDAP